MNVNYQRKRRNPFLVSISGIDNILSGMASIGGIYAPTVVFVKYRHSFPKDQENIGMDMWNAIEAYNHEEEAKPKISQSTIATAE